MKSTGLRAQSTGHRGRSSGRRAQRKKRRAQGTVTGLAGLANRAGLFQCGASPIIHRL
ncbi:MAG: hypothetical protein GX293_00025 [Bacteroidales bacterium]|nr:hypothetical protein [Bacteroidales bacterium]